MITSNPTDTYRLEHPTISEVLHDMRIPDRDPGPGDSLPVFDLPTTDGGRVTSAELSAGDRPTLLVFGSLTCPVTESAGAGLVELHARFGDRVRFVFVAVREAHPGARTPQPATIEQKTRNAAALRDHHGIPFEMAVDDIDGTLHRAFGTRPSSAYLIDPTGVIVFRAHWSNATDALGDALDAVAAGHPVPHPTVGHTVASMFTMTGHADVAFAAGGSGAWADTWKVAPPFAAMIATSKLFGFLPRSKRGLPTVLTLAAGAALAIGIAVTLIGG